MSSRVTLYGQPCHQSHCPEILGDYLALSEGKFAAGVLRQARLVAGSVGLGMNPGHTELELLIEFMWLGLKPRFTKAGLDPIYEGANLWPSWSTEG